MCGIVGLFAKSPDVELRLGALLGEMLTQLADRGPDSAGIALYREPAAVGSTKLSLFSPDANEDWSALGDADACTRATRWSSWRARRRRRRRGCAPASRTCA